MKIENGKLVLEERKCSCRDGKITPSLLCELNGKAQRGKPCHKCGSTTKQHKYIPQPERQCSWCNGSGMRPETETDSLPKEEWQKFEFRVIREVRRMGLLEQTFGFGVYTCGDYGRAWAKENDQELIEEVRDHSGVQASKLLKDGKLCDYIGILLAPQGYSVCGVFDEIPQTGW